MSQKSIDDCDDDNNDDDDVPTKSVAYWDFLILYLPEYLVSDAKNQDSTKRGCHV